MRRFLAPGANPPGGLAPGDAIGHSGRDDGRILAPHDRSRRRVGSGGLIPSISCPQCRLPTGRASAGSRSTPISSPRATRSPPPHCGMTDSHDNAPSARDSGPRPDPRKVACSWIRFRRLRRAAPVPLRCTASWMTPGPSPVLRPPTCAPRPRPWSGSRRPEKVQAGTRSSGDCSPNSSIDARTPGRRPKRICCWPRQALNSHGTSECPSGVPRARPDRMGPHRRAHVCHVASCRPRLDPHRTVGALRA